MASEPYARAYADPRAREASQTDTRGRGGDWLWRHRAQVVPLGLIGALIGLIDLDHPLLLIALLVVAGPLAGVWMWRRRVRPRIEVVGGSIWPFRWSRWQFRREAKRELERAFAQWPIAAPRAKVPGSELRSAVADYDSGDYMLYLDLAPGHIWSDLDLNRAGSILRAEHRTVSVEPDTHHHRVVIMWTAEPPEPIEFAEPAVSFSEPEAVDKDADRLERIHAVLQSATRPMSARKVAEATDLPRDWVWRVGLRELERVGKAQLSADGWESAA